MIWYYRKKSCLKLDDYLVVISLIRSVNMVLLLLDMVLYDQIIFDDSMIILCIYSIRSDII
jgi:hypothetical protein